VSARFDEHRTYLLDANRIDAYARALTSVVREGDVVVDLGAGTGVLGILALRAGASRVYAIDEGRMLPVARAMYAANGAGDRVTFVKGHSTAIDLPERAHVVVADQMGPLGIDAGLTECFADARARFLVPGGRCVPSRLQLLLAPLSDPEIAADLDTSSAPDLGVNRDVMRQWASIDMRSRRVREADVFGPEVVAALVELGEASMSYRLSATLDIERDGVLNALGAWFRAELAPSIAISNSPLDSGAIDRAQCVLPLGPTAVVRGDRLEVVMDARLDADVYRWRATVCAGDGSTKARYDHCSLDRPLLSAEMLKNLDPQRTPRLDARGQARLFVLSRCDGAHTQGEIERALLESHPRLFPTRARAAGFVARIVDGDT
jgi:hypothetical protein